MSNSILGKFHPIVRSWFEEAFGEPSLPQLNGWPSIADGNNTLIVAPTGSGKTLAAFLWCINHLVEENVTMPFHGFDEDNAIPTRSNKRMQKQKKENPVGGIRILYISPLKALNNDIHRNLEIPLKGIQERATIQGVALTPIRTAVRTGDTTQTERTRMVKNPPDILITTPESLYLMLTAGKTRPILHTVQYVIVDEIHAISNNKRGVHLSLTLERLEELVRQTRGSEARSFVRIGLSATQKPLDEVAKFLGGFEYRNAQHIPRPVTIIDAGYKKSVDLRVLCAPYDFTNLQNNSVWNSIYPQLLEIIRHHRSTLIFVNNRRLAERLSARLNEMLEGVTDSHALYAVPHFTEKEISGKTVAPFKVFAYHGSMSRTVRERLESDLKNGTIRALVTTSALELGIDIGSVDLVVQIQSPKGIARGLQRVGRSGHLVRAESKGRIFVTHREDLLESAVVAQAMTEHAIERTSIPKNCLDVLAQQIVAMVSIEDWNAEDLLNVIRRSYCYLTVSENIYSAVLDMIGGRFSTDAFRELRARIVWDKLHNTLTALPGSSILAITNAGTIPDRGYYSVYLEDRKTKVGEVDEEFIYESRTGDTFILGSSVWRMIDIDANTVVVQPAPGHPARMPFWRGEMFGRTYELCMKLGDFTENLFSRVTADQTPHHDISGQWLKENYPVDDHSVRNIIDYIEEQHAATHHIPSHRTIVVEGFRDEVGDPRILVHSRYGKGINGLLGLVVLHHLKERLTIDVQMLYNDDGILFRCSDVERLPLDIFSSLDFPSAERVILEQLPSSPLFGALFRQNAERSLLLPKGNPGKRRPFFLQRLKAADLLQIVKQYSDFPIVIETVRECITDVLDFDHFKDVLAKIENGEIFVHTVQTDVPSPFASSLLFDFTMTYMYEWDDPKSASKGQVAQLNRDLLSDVVQISDIRSVVRDDAIRTVEEQLQFVTATRKARSVSELMEVMLRLGELTEEEMRERCDHAEFIAALQNTNTITRLTIGTNEYFILTEEIPIYASIASAIEEGPPHHPVIPGFQRNESLHYVILRMLRTHGPLSVEEIQQRYAIGPTECTAILASLKQTENILQGTFTNEAATEQWCYRPNLERIHRASITILRKEIKPASLSHFTQLLLQWQHRHPDTPVEGEEGIRSVMEKMQGYAMPAELWESEIFRHRTKRYDGSIIRSLLARGEIVCVGQHSGKSALMERGSGRYFLDDRNQVISDLPPAAHSVLAYLSRNGASFLSDIREELNISLAALNRSLSALFWSGLITNDMFDEVTNLKRYKMNDEAERNNPLRLPDERIRLINSRKNPLKKIAMRGVRQAIKNVPGWHGRWSIVHTRSILGTPISDEEKIEFQAKQLLLRYGIVAREIAKREVNLLSWPLLAMEFQRLEMRGEIRRGYFVEGLSGMQFALPEAVGLLELIKNNPLSAEEPIVVNACDPANPYGIGVEMQSAPHTPQRISRLPSNYIIVERGTPTVWLENYGSKMYFLADTEPVRRSLHRFVDHLRVSLLDKQEIIVEYCNNRRPGESEAGEILQSVGFYRDKVQTMRIDLR